jgi:hypothetical protein
LVTCFGGKIFSFQKEIFGGLAHDRQTAASLSYHTAPSRALRINWGFLEEYAVVYLHVLMEVSSLLGCPGTIWHTNKLS